MNPLLPPIINTSPKSIDLILQNNLFNNSLLPPYNSFMENKDI